MPIPGETKREYCCICCQETQWEYVVVQLGDGVLGFANAILPEAHQIKLWRCCTHTTPDGRILEEFRHKARLTHIAPIGDLEPDAY